MSEAPRRRLGRTTIEVPAFGLGCAPLAGLQAPVAEGAADALLETAWAQGVRYYDTAPWYGRGLSELRTGRMLRQAPREQFVISTKVGRTFHRPQNPDTFRSAFWAGGLPFEHRFDYTYDGVMRAYEQSLMRLGLNRIDILLIHDLDLAELGSEDLVARHLRDLETSGWRALESLRTAGEVRALGAGVNIRGTMATMLARFDLDLFLVAMPYTLLDQAVLDDEFPLCHSRGVGIVVGAPYASGILATGAAHPGSLYNYEPAPSEVIAKVAKIEALCERHSIPRQAAALQFPLRQPQVASVIAGAISSDQLQANLAWMRVPIPEAFWDELRASGLVHPASP
jgi:D-threo-aldose 1-dehydrogenase